MGLLLEGLWGYFMSDLLQEHGLEMAWLADHQYNDFACLPLDAAWDPATRTGELLRVEAKSVNMGADESKAHFDELERNIHPDDLLVVIAWRWTEDGSRVWPCVIDIFTERARPIAVLRDKLHTARGGTFVRSETCPDGCSPVPCSHDGEPLNANGKRERLHGPESTRVSNKVSHAANFGGLLRMLHARSDAARKIKLAAIETDPAAAAYVQFVEGHAWGDEA